MTGIYLIAIGSLLLNVVQFIVWRVTARDCQRYFDKWAGAVLHLAHWNEYGLLRDPKTGRYTKKGPQA